MSVVDEVKTANEPPSLLHPSMADLYRTKVQQLAEALRREDARTEASEMLRGLIDSIVLTPEKGHLRIELRGNLAAMLTAAQKTSRSPETGDLLVPVQLVAGAGFEPATFGLLAKRNSGPSGPQRSNLPLIRRICGPTHRFNALSLVPTLVPTASNPSPSP